MLAAFRDGKKLSGNEMLGVLKDLGFRADDFDGCPDEHLAGIMRSAVGLHPGGKYCNFSEDDEDDSEEMKEAKAYYKKYADDFKKYGVSFDEYVKAKRSQSPPSDRNRAAMKVKTQGLVNLSEQVKQVEDHYEKFSEAFQRTGTTKEELTTAFKSQQKREPALTAERFLNVK